MAAEMDFSLASEDLGLGRLESNPAGSLEATRNLLSKNHEKWHMYFRDIAGHNHIPHAVLTTLAMGGGPKELRRAYDDGEDIQRPMPVVDQQAVREMADPAGFRAHMQVLDEYPNFLAYFKQQIADRGGSWQDVVNDSLFSRTELADFMLAQFYEGLYHPIIHLAFGVEFGLPGLVAEGLAQTASHDPMHIDAFFQRAEKLARDSGPTAAAGRRPLADLYRQTRADEKLRTAARLPDGPWRVRDGVLGRAMDEMAAVAAQFRVAAAEADVERAAAEVMSCAAWACAAAHKPGRERKIDFFLMHSVTSSLSLVVLARQPWIRLEDRARLVEWKARLDLVWYASCAAPELRDELCAGYEPTVSKGMGWRELYHAVNQHHDDGHVAKFVRAINIGEQVAAPFEKGLANGGAVNGHAAVDGSSTNGGGGAAEFLPVRGDAWLKIAQLCYDTTVMHVDGQKKWVWGAGFDRMWDAVPDHLKRT